MTNSEYAKNLHDLADWLEAHPEVDPPEDRFVVYSMNSKEQAAACIRAMRPCRKEYNNSMFTLVKDFGGLQLRVVFYREAVCTKKVVGKRLVEAHVDPGHVVPASFVPAHEEDIVEWECHEALSAIPEEAAELPEAEEPETLL